MKIPKKKWGEGSGRGVGLGGQGRCYRSEKEVFVKIQKKLLGAVGGGGGGWGGGVSVDVNEEWSY